jgi:hypothetical protein
MKANWIPALRTLVQLIAPWWLEMSMPGVVAWADAAVTPTRVAVTTPRTDPRASGRRSRAVHRLVTAPVLTELLIEPPDAEAGAASSAFIFED